jgi:hypothetical protein
MKYLIFIKLLSFIFYMIAVFGILYYYDWKLLLFLWLFVGSYIDNLRFNNE